MNIGNITAKWAALDPSRPAIVDIPTGRRVSFGASGGSAAVAPPPTRGRRTSSAERDGRDAETELSRSADGWSMFGSSRGYSDFGAGFGDEVRPSYAMRENTLAGAP